MTSNLTDVSIDYNTNTKTVIDQVTKRLADDETNISVINYRLENTFVRGKGERIQSGQATGTVVTPGTAVTVAVTFPIAYVAAPIVKLSIQSAAGGTAGYINAFAENITVTGFTLRLNSYAAGAIVVNWEATGK